MGLLFQVLKRVFGLLLVAQGFAAVWLDKKDIQQGLKDARNTFLFGEAAALDNLVATSVLTSDKLLVNLVFVYAGLLLVGGLLLLINVPKGGYLGALAYVMLVVSKDNPFLANS